MAGTAPNAVPTATMATRPAAAESADTMELIENTWKYAQKMRGVIHKELDRIQRLGQDGDGAMAGFGKVEEFLKKYRLSCLEIIMVDIRAAKARNVEETLWNTHTLVTKTYRKVIGTLQGSNFVVVKRKVEKLYQTYLMTSQSFYRTYLQRFCGSYKMKELERVARIVKFDEQPGAGIVPPQAATKEVEELVNVSFYKTLIYLGDLSRYRTLLRPKDRSFDSALTYYALANELMPESGHGYHQSGVIYGEMNNHLEIVYNMYRAMACDYPHPLAKTNLEREFRDLRQQKPGGIKPGSVKDTVEAMVSWFVKLHAFYYNGEEFTASKEMEDEVDNHLAMALKTGAGSKLDMVLLKMVLISITAYVVGKDSIQAEWTVAKSRSCQSILRLNVRTLHTISKLLRDQLQDLVQQKPSQPAVGNHESTDNQESQSKFTPAFHRILPLFRVYMTWLCFYSSELAEFRSFLEPQFGNMCKILTHTLTLLLELLGTGEDLATAVTWLFPEDEETIGIKCLNGPELYDGCQLRYDALKQKPKPRADDISGGDFSVDKAAFIRIFDTVLCGLRLADHSSFPIALSDGSKLFSYVEGVKLQNVDSEQTAVPPTQPQARINTDVNVTASSAMAAVAPQATPAMPTPSPSAPIQVPVSVAVSVAREAEDFSDDEEFFPSQNQKSGSSAGIKSRTAAEPSQPASTSEFPLNTMLSNILNEFLTPPELLTGRPVVRQEETSYSMGSRTANDIWGPAVSTSPAPGSATSKTFPSLPWGYFLPAKAPDSGARNPSTVRSGGSGWDSRPGSGGSTMGAQHLENMNDSFTSRGGSWTKQNRLSGSAATSPFSNHAAQDLAAQPGRDSKLRDNQGLQAQHIRDMWPKAESSSGMHSRKPSDALSSPWSPSAGPWQQQSQFGASGHLTSNSPFASAFAFSADSSMPQVNSPWGVPGVNQQAQMYQSSSSATQQTPMFPEISPSSVTGLAYPPHLPPGLVSPPGFPPGNGSAFDPTMWYGQFTMGGLTSHQSYAAGQSEEYDGQALSSAWNSDFGARSTGMDALGLNDDESLGLVNGRAQASTTRGRNRVVPTFDWEAKQRPKPK